MRTNVKTVRKYAGAALCGLVLALSSFAAMGVAPPPYPDWLKMSPDPNVMPPKWDWQLAVPVKLNADATIKIYDIEMFENEKNTTVQMLHANGKKVICYVDVGSWENWRDDAAQFPASILGTTYSGFPDERWLDIRDVNPLKSTTGTKLAYILKARFDRAKAMGCDAIEPDNMDGYDSTAHEASGFPLTYEDQILFNLWVADEVHSRGMYVGLKNNINQARDSRIYMAFDFVVSEQCFQYKECQFFDKFLELDKPVFEAEYGMALTKFCPKAKPLRISAIKKRPALNTRREDCRAYY